MATVSEFQVGGRRVKSKRLNQKINILKMLKNPKKSKIEKNDNFGGQLKISIFNNQKKIL